MDGYKQKPSTSFDHDAWRTPPSGGTQVVGRNGWITIALALVATLPLAFGLKYVSETQERRAIEREGAVENQGKAYIAALLRDPSSAQFRAVKVYHDCLLGEVNGKNAFGGYGGFVEFYYDRRTDAGAIEPTVSDLHLSQVDRLRDGLIRAEFPRAQAACLHRDNDP